MKVCSSNKTNLLIAGIALIVIGVILAVVLIAYQYDQCAYQWLNDINGFGRKYDSAWDCFTERSTGLIVIAIAIGAVCEALGIFLLFRRKE